MKQSLKQWRNLLGVLALGSAAALALAALVHPESAHAAAIVDFLPNDPAKLGRDDVVKVLVNLIQWGLMFASAIGAIFIVVNGYQYVLSAGNPEKIEKAKLGLTWSIGGFILVISSYAAVHLLASTLEATQLKDSLEAHQPAALPGGAPGILTSISRVIFIFAGAVAVTFLILGGYRYITSQGNQDLVEKAKKTIIYALIGLIVVFISASLFDFIATSLEVTNRFK